MLKIGITGGIGSGKSVVCRVFSCMGVPVFNADETAKDLMNNNVALKGGIIRLLGLGVYKDGRLENGMVSSRIFQEPGLLQQFNALVHPVTIAASKHWLEAQTAPYVLKEAAILFESGSNKDLDLVIGVTAPIELRIQRVMQRSGHSREKVLSIMANQMDDVEKMKLCDFVIVNDELQAVIPQVAKLHEALLMRHAVTS